MTTDTYPKLATATAAIDGVKVTLNGIAKGSGMIAPDMATMLAFVFTDATLARRGVAGMPERRRGTVLQFHHGGFRHLDQRHAAPVRHRQGRQARRGDARPRTSGLPVSAGAWTRCCSIWRLRWSRTARARRNSSRSMSAGRKATMRRRRVALSDRQFAAGQDRDRRQRRQLGPGGDGGGQSPAKRPTATNSKSPSAARSSRRRVPGRPNMTKPLATKAVSGREVQIAVDLGLGKGVGPGLDLRPDPRLYRH